MPEIPRSLAVDARAEIIWGTAPEKVRESLLSKGVDEADAAELIESVMRERSETIRAEGIKKLVYGILFVVAPVAYYAIALLMEVLFIKLFAALCVLGVVGIYKIIAGTAMILKPRSHTGDLSNMNG